MLKFNKKDKISYESLVAGALIRFDKVDLADMDVLIDEVYSMYEIDVTKKPVFNPNINFEKGLYTLVGETEEERFDAKVRLGEIQGDKVKALIGCINPDILVLRKVELCGSIDKGEVSSFNVEEIVAISKVLNEGLLSIRWNNDCIPNDYEEIYLTQLGRKRLFCLEYFAEIEEFEKLLDSEEYDSGLIQDFLMTQDLTFGVYEILNLDNFFNFCDTYDRNRYASKQEKSDKKGKGTGLKKVPKDKK